MYDTLEEALKDLHAWQPLLKKKYKDKWLKALRSGRYEQGKGALHVASLASHDTYCCLGVICKELVKPLNLTVTSGPNRAGRVSYLYNPLDEDTLGRMSYYESNGVLPLTIKFEIFRKPTKKQKSHPRHNDFHNEGGVSVVIPVFSDDRKLLGYRELLGYKEANVLHLNDEGKDFNYIADAIERSL